MKTNVLHVAMLTCMLALAGCGTIPLSPQVIKIDVPIPIPCNIVPPRQPSLPLTNGVPEDTQTNGVEDILKILKLALAEIEFRKGYEVELEAAIKACNSK